MFAPRQRRFLQLAASGYIYHTEDWKPKHEALYLPVEDDLLVSTANIEQISFSSGNYFVADTAGVYCGSQSGETKKQIHVNKRKYIKRIYTCITK